MDTIHLNINRNKILSLKFLRAIHPSLAHPKADQWKFIYQLYQDNTVIDTGLFTSSYLIVQERELLILEEYDVSILDKEAIHTNEDVVLNLRLFDFAESKTGNFSKLSGGSFLIQKLINDTLIFSKQYSDKTVEFEINITDIKLINSPLLAAHK